MLKLPREHGITSIWLSTLAYAILQIKELNPFTPIAILGSFVSLLLADYMLVCIANRRFRRGLSGMIIIALIYSPILVVRFQQLITPIVIFAILLMLLIYLTREGKPITHGSTAVGGGLIAVHSTFILVSGGVASSWIHLFPVIYSLTATSQASLGVIGYQRNIAMIFYSMLATLSLFGFVFYFLASPFSLYIIIADTLSRVVQDISGLSARISIKAYGLMEFFRTLIVLSSLGIILGM